MNNPPPFVDGAGNVDTGIDDDIGIDDEPDTPVNAHTFNASTQRRDFRGRVLLLSLLRVAHLVGVVGSGAVLLGAKPLAGSEAYALVLVGSGLGILLLDRWTNPDYLRQVSGLGILLKISLLAITVLLAGLIEPVFWIVLVGSVLLTHAPRRMRHRLMLPRSTRSQRCPRRN